MIYIFSLFALLTISCYIFYSRRERSYLNAFSVVTLLKVIIEFVLEPLSYYLGFYDYRPEIFFQIYLASFLGYLGLILGALRFQPNRARLQSFLRPVPHFLPWVFLGMGVLLYLPILIEFRDHVLDPRYIYEQTRTGYGLMFFGSAMLVNCALILFLLSRRTKHWLFLSMLILFVLLKGQKGQFVTIASIYVMWALYVLGVRFGAIKTISIVGVMVAAFSGLFVLNYRGEIESLVLVVAGYSDYNRNAALVIEDRSLPVFNGQISAESLLISKVPRSVWPEKPKNFGPFRLAERYFPEWFELDQGSPAFGVGTLFSDFGVAAIPISLVIGLLSGIMFRYFLVRLERRPGVFVFVMTLFAADVVLLPVGVGYFLLEHLALAWLLHRLVHFSRRCHL